MAYAHDDRTNAFALAIDRLTAVEIRSRDYTPDGSALLPFLL
jgi:hypothetical protein